MKKLVQLLAGGVAVIVVATLIGVAHNAVRSTPLELVPNLEASEPTGGVEDAAERRLSQGPISVEGMKQIVEEGLTFVVDARGASDYARGHIPGAISMPYEDLASRLPTLLADLPPDQPVVCYCTGPDCDLGELLATELRIMGYQDVRVFVGGWEHWTEAGFGAVTGTEPE